MTGAIATGRGCSVLIRVLRRRGVLSGVRGRHNVRHAQESHALHGYQIDRLGSRSLEGCGLARVGQVAKELWAPKPTTRSRRQGKATRICVCLGLRNSERAVSATAGCCNMDGAVRIQCALSSGGRKAEPAIVAARNTGARVANRAAGSRHAACAGSRRAAGFCEAACARTRVSPDSAHAPERTVSRLLRCLATGQSPSDEQDGRPPSRAPCGSRPKDSVVTQWRLHLNSVPAFATVLEQVSRRRGARPGSRERVRRA